MRLILELSVDGATETAEAQMYAEILKQRIEHKQDQGFPGAMMEMGDGSVWVSGVTLEAQRVPNSSKKPDLKLVKPLDTEAGSKAD